MTRIGRGRDVPGDEQMRCPQEKNLASCNWTASGCRCLGRPNQNIGDPRGWQAVARPEQRQLQKNQKREMTGTADKDGSGYGGGEAERLR